MKLLCKKQSGFSILAVILVIVAVVVAIGVWALSGNSNSQQGSSASTDTMAASIISNGILIKSTFDQYTINGINGNFIVYKPGVSGTANEPNILDSVTGIMAPVVSSKALRQGATFPEGVWAYTNTYENNQLSIADAPGAVVLGLNEQTCQAINKILHGETAIPSNYDSSSNITMGMTTTNPYVTRFNTEIDYTTYPKLIGWQQGCMKMSDDIYVYFQALVRPGWN